MKRRGDLAVLRRQGAPEATSAASRPRLSVVESVAAGLGTDALALASEDALLVRVVLPLASHRQRQAAVGFAIEDLIAEPLEVSHVVLGPELAPGEYLAVVVRHAVMADYAARASNQRLVPDVLALPVPAPGSCSVREVNGRILARRADGTGFATRAAAFETFWQAEGAPKIVLFGGRLPDDVPVSASGLMPAGPTPEALATNLFQGRHARNAGTQRRALTRLGAVLAFALAAHAAILGVDTLALKEIARDREATLRAEIAARMPDLPETIPLDMALRRALPAEAGAQDDGFLRLLARVSEALQPVAGAIAVRDLAFDAADGLSLLVEAPDLVTLQRAEAELGAAGLLVSSGVATTGAGGAEARYMIGATGG
jgi:general secretion pathway protein L